MLAFKSRDWFNIAGRGWVATTYLPKGVQVSEVQGHEVEIDGKAYHCLAVERHMLLMDPPRPSPHVGLLIRGPR